MRIFWDEAKRLLNIAKHGLDFADFEEAFGFRGAIAVEARRSDTGRRRQKLIGRMGGRAVVAAIVSPLGTEALSLVSLRPATAKETQRHDLGSPRPGLRPQP